MKAWHFVGDKLRDGSPVPPDGKWLVHDGELILCESGYHASERLIDALHWATGDTKTICRVKLGGTVMEYSDKLVAEKRKILWRIDGDKLLRAFARWCALQVVESWDAPEAVIEGLITGSAGADKNLWYLVEAVIKNGDWDPYSAARQSMLAALWAHTPEARNNAYQVAFMAAERSCSAICLNSRKWDARIDATNAQNEQLERMVYEARDGKTEWTFQR